MKKPTKEPIKNVKIWIVLGLIFLLCVPWYFPQGSYKPLIFGIPYWALFIIAASIALSAFLTYVLKYEWHMEEEEASRVKEDE